MEEKSPDYTGNYDEEIVEKTKGYIKGTKKPEKTIKRISEKSVKECFAEEMNEFRDKNPPKKKTKISKKEKQPRKKQNESNTNEIISYDISYDLLAKPIKVLSKEGDKNHNYPTYYILDCGPDKSILIDSIIVKNFEFWKNYIEEIMYDQIETLTDQYILLNRRVGEEKKNKKNIEKIKDHKTTITDLYLLLNPSVNSHLTEKDIDTIIPAINERCEMIIPKLIGNNIILIDKGYKPDEYEHEESTIIDERDMIEYGIELQEEIYPIQKLEKIINYLLEWNIEFEPKDIGFVLKEYESGEERYIEKIIDELFNTDPFRLREYQISNARLGNYF